MELGQRLRQARLEAGMTQRQLCGDEITRNMLSQIENGTARPSMETLRFLAHRLGKPMGWFLEEQAVLSPNQAAMSAARAAFAAGDAARTRAELTAYRSPDPQFDWERALLEAMSSLTLARQALDKGQLPYALELLEKAAELGAATPYYGVELERSRLLLLAEAGQPVALPSDDRELLLRAEAQLARSPLRAGEYLDAAEDHQAPRWQFLRGRVFMAQGDFSRAADCFRAAETLYPVETARALEQCCRELEDFKGAYFYACKLRELEK